MDPIMGNESLGELKTLWRELNDRTIDIMKRLLRLDEAVCKSANSINVIVRLIAGSQRISSSELAQILIDAKALTNTVESTTNVNLEDIPAESLDFLKSQLLNSLKTIDSIILEKSTNLPSTRATNATVSETSSLQNTINPDQSSLATTSNMLEDTSNNLGCENSKNNETVPNVMPNDINTNRIKELEELEVLRKKYRNKYLYLDKYKNVKKTNSTQDIEMSVNKPNPTQDDVKNVNKPNSSQNEVKNIKNVSRVKDGDKHPVGIELLNGNKPNSTLNSFTDCALYRDPIFNGVENVEILYIEDEYCSPKHIIRPLYDIQPRVLINKFDVNNPPIQTKINDLSNPQHNHRKNLIFNKNTKVMKQKSKNIANPKNNTRSTTIKNSPSGSSEKKVKKTIKQ